MIQSIGGRRRVGGKFLRGLMGWRRVVLSWSKVIMRKARRKEMKNLVKVKVNRKWRKILLKKSRSTESSPHRKTKTIQARVHILDLKTTTKTSKKKNQTKTTDDKKSVNF